MSKKTNIEDMRKTKMCFNKMIDFCYRFCYCYNNDSVALSDTDPESRSSERVSTRTSIIFFVFVNAYKFLSVTRWAAIQLRSFRQKRFLFIL